MNEEQAKQYCIGAKEQGWEITHCGVDVSKLGVKEVKYGVNELEDLLGSLSI